MTFVREVEGNRVLCVMNLSPYTIHADFNTGIYQGEYADALTGNRIVVPYRVEQDMAPWSYRILIRECSGPGLVVHRFGFCDGRPNRSERAWRFGIFDLSLRR